MSSFILPALLVRGRLPQLAMTVAAFAIAVAAVCAVDVINQAVLAAFDEVVDGMAGRASLQVTSGDGGLVAEAVAGRLSRVRGIERSVPVVIATAFETNGEALTVFGANVANADVVRVYEPGNAGLEGPGLLVRHPEAILVPRGLAGRRGLTTGDSLELDTPSGRRSFIIAGLIEPEGLARVLGGNLIVMLLPSAQAVFTRPGFVNRIDLVVRPEEDVTRLQHVIEAELPPGLRVATPVQRKLDLHRVMRSFTLVLWTAAAIGVVLSFLVAFNQLATHFETRAGEAAILRAIGLRQNAVVGVRLRESLILAAAGIGLGLPLGIGLGHAALPAVAAAAALNQGESVPAVEPHVRAWSMALAAGVGVVAAVMAAALPCWRAARVAIAETLWRRGSEQPSIAGPLPWVVRGAVVLALCAAVVAQAVTRSPVWGLVATGLIVAVTVVVPGLLLGLLRGVLAPGLYLAAGAVGPLAAAALVHNLRRTALTIAIMGIGLGCVLWMCTVAQSFAGSLVSVLESTVHAELVVTSPHIVSGWVPAPIADAVLGEIASVPGVVAVAGNRVADWSYGIQSVAINAFDGAYFGNPELGRPHLLAGSLPDALGAVGRGEGIIVSTNFARGFGTRVGDDIVLETPQGPLRAPVVGLTMAFLSPGGTIEMSRELYRRYWLDDQVNRIWVHTATGADQNAVRDAIARALGGRYPLRVLSADEMRDYLVAQVRRAFAPLWIAEAVVLLVVLVGVGDTLAASVARRVRHLGMMRAVGVRRAVVRRLVLAEGLMIGALGVLLAVAAGIGPALLWVGATFPDLLGWVLDLHIPYAAVGGAALLTLAVCLVAAIVPARRAARLEVAVALRYE